jgi:phosphatidylglycerophosphate synthase
MKKIVVNDVRKSFNYLAPTYWSIKWFSRPIADIVTPFFYNGGWSANQVTFFRTIISLFMLALLMTGENAMLAMSAVFFYVCYILDSVDGNIARISDSATYWGKFIDGISDSIGILLAPFAAGIGLWVQDENIFWLIAGSSISIVSLLTEIVRQRLNSYRVWMISQSGEIDKKKIDICNKIEKNVHLYSSININGSFLAPIALFFPLGLMAYILVLSVTQGLFSLLWLIVLIFQGKTILNRKRKSRCAVC